MAIDLGYTLVSVQVDPDGTDPAPRSAIPAADAYHTLRPALRVGVVAIAVDHERDASAAAWWRELAGKAGELAAWYDARGS